MAHPTTWPCEPACPQHSNTLHNSNQQGLPSPRHDRTDRNADRSARVLPTRQARRHRLSRATSLRNALGLAAVFFATQVAAVLIPFENCLGPERIYTKQPDPSRVLTQWVPQFVDARFDVNGAAHNLIVTVWGNVTGRTTTDLLPPPGSPQWTNGNFTNGKIVDVDLSAPGTDQTTTALTSKVNVLTYTQYSSSEPFCNSILNGTCPVAPVFNTTALCVILSSLCSSQRSL